MQLTYLEKYVLYSKGFRKSQSQVDKVETEKQYITEDASQGFDATGGRLKDFFSCLASLA